MHSNSASYARHRPGCPGVAAAPYRLRRYGDVPQTCANTTDSGARAERSMVICSVVSHLYTISERERERVGGKRPGVWGRGRNTRIHVCFWHKPTLGCCAGRRCTGSRLVVRRRHQRHVRVLSGRMPRSSDSGVAITIWVLISKDDCVDSLFFFFFFFFPLSLPLTIRRSALSASRSALPRSSSRATGTRTFCLSISTASSTKSACWSWPPSRHASLWTSTETGSWSRWSRSQPYSWPVGESVSWWSSPGR